MQQTCCFCFVLEKGIQVLCIWWVVAWLISFCLLTAGAMRPLFLASTLLFLPNILMFWKMHSSGYGVPQRRLMFKVYLISVIIHSLTRVAAVFLMLLKQGKLDSLDGSALAQMEAK